MAALVATLAFAPAAMTQTDVPARHAAEARTATIVEAAKAFLASLSEEQRRGVRCSMTDGYDCHQNAMAERVNGILKNEFLLTRPPDLATARCMVAQSVKIYNDERPHLSLKMQTPAAMHRASIAG